MSWFAGGVGGGVRCRFINFPREREMKYDIQLASGPVFTHTAVQYSHNFFHKKLFSAKNCFLVGALSCMHYFHFHFTIVYNFTTGLQPYSKQSQDFIKQLDSLLLYEVGINKSEYSTRVMNSAYYKSLTA